MNVPSVDSVIIRAAQKSDMAAVHKLIIELADYEKAKDEVMTTVQDLEEDGFGNQPAFECLVADWNGQVIGFALYFTSYSTWKGKALYLEDFLVTQQYRRTGIGNKLFEAVKEKAIARKVRRFHWQVLDWNEPAIQFYEKKKAELDATWINCKLVFSPE